jgi:hypothetical protein
MKPGIMFASVAFVLLVSVAGCDSRKPPSSETPDTEQAMEPLPADVEGVEVLGGLLRVKPGYEWVQQKDSTFMVRRLSDAGGGIVIRVGCGCDTGPYACEAVQVDDTTIRCQTKGDCLSCKWFRPTVAVL